MVFGGQKRPQHRGPVWGPGNLDSSTPDWYKDRQKINNLLVTDVCVRGVCDVCDALYRLVKKGKERK